MRLNIPLLFLLGVYILVRSAYWACPPIWDGMIYYASLLQANAAPFNLFNYSADSHVCQGMFLLASLPYPFIGRDYFLFNLWITGFGIASILAFYRIVEFFSEGRMGRVELALVSALFAFHPSVLASMIHFTLDVGLLTFFLCYWLFLLKGRAVWALFCGLLLVFTKESGWILLPLPFLFCLLSQPSCSRAGWLKRHWPAAVLPYVAVAGFLLFRTMASTQPVVWREYGDRGGLGGILKQAFAVDEKLNNFLMMIFVMNFNWVLWLVCLVVLVLLARRAAPQELTGRQRPLLVYLLLVAAIAAVLLVRPYSNVRYVIVVFPLLIVSVLYWALMLEVPRNVRVWTALVLLGFFAASNVRTLDPLSRAYFGTLTFGRHEILAVSRKTREPGGWGRDQLVYNLEFLKFPQLLAKIMQDLRPRPQTFIVNHPWMDFNHSLAESGILTRLDSASFKPTFELKDSFELRHMTADGLLKLDELPVEVYYLAFPNCDNSTELGKLAVHYTRQEERIYDIGGYQIPVVHFMK